MNCISSSNWSGVRLCAPSHLALAGLLCTSIIRPSAPAATAAFASSGTIHAWPQAWLEVLSMGPKRLVLTLAIQCYLWSTYFVQLRIAKVKPCKVPLISTWDKLIFKVKRDKIPVTTMDAAYMIRPGIGYIRLGSFGLTSHKEVTIAMDSLKKKGMKDLIFDLEDNGGGYLQAAAQIANEFLQKGDLIVYTSGRAAPRQEYKAQANGRWRNGKVVVLTNEFTASAAEIVSGAIQDQDRGVVVGRRTFGKGLVQRPLTFDDGSEIRLTIAHYYTPSGRCIQKPYKKGDRLDYAMDLDKRYKHGEFTNQDSIHLSDSLKYYTLRKHRVVYGGGGIMPDYFVPLDTTKYTKMHRQLAAKSIVINHSLKFIDAHRKELKSQYKDFDKFLATYEVPSSLIEGIIAEGKKEKIEPKDEAELIQTKKYLALQLKALVARDIWDMSQYFQVWNETNEIVQRAVQLLTTGK